MFPSASYIRYSVYYILFSVFLLIKILVTISEDSRHTDGGQSNLLQFRGSATLPNSTFLP